MKSFFACCKVKYPQAAKQSENCCKYQCMFVAKLYDYSISDVSLPVGSKVSSLCTKYSAMSKFCGSSVGV